MEIQRITGNSRAFNQNVLLDILRLLCSPYGLEEVGTLQSLSCFCLALASVAFVYPCPWLARVALIAPVLLVLLQARNQMNSTLARNPLADSFLLDSFQNSWPTAAIERETEWHYTTTPLAKRSR